MLGSENMWFLGVLDIVYEKNCYVLCKLVVCDEMFFVVYISWIDC